MSLIDPILKINPKDDPFEYRDPISEGTIVHYCIEENELDYLKEVLNKENLVNKLLDTKIIDIPNKYGVHPFSIAVLENKNKFIKLFIENKCKTFTKDLEGKTAYHYNLLSKKPGNFSFNKESHFILALINNEKTIIFVNDLLTDEFIEKILDLANKEGSTQIKLYFKEDVSTKSILNSNLKVIIGEISSMLTNTKFLNYL